MAVGTKPIIRKSTKFIGAKSLEFGWLAAGQRFFRDDDVDGAGNMKVPTSSAGGVRFNATTTAWGDDGHDGNEPDNYAMLVPNEEIVHFYTNRQRLDD